MSIFQVSAFSHTKIHVSYKFGAQNHSSFKFFKLLGLGFSMDEQKFHKALHYLPCITFTSKQVPFEADIWKR